MIIGNNFNPNQNSSFERNNFNRNKPKNNMPNQNSENRFSNNLLTKDISSFQHANIENKSEIFYNYCSIKIGA